MFGDHDVKPGPIACSPGTWPFRNRGRVGGGQAAVRHGQAGLPAGAVFGAGRDVRRAGLAHPGHRPPRHHRCAAAGKINGAAHDSLADSWWDQFKQEIGAIADNLKTIATIIGYVATVCAILAVILTGPLALVFLLIAGGLLLTELGIHTILAATGNGSWVDVGLDVIALATLGYGSVLDAGADAAEKTASDAAVEAVQEDSGLTSAVEGARRPGNRAQRGSHRTRRRRDNSSL